MSTVDSETKPATRAPRFEDIPAALTREHAWVGWRWERDDKGKWTKPLYVLSTVGPQAGRKASTTDATTWRPFEDALILFDSRRWDGIGIVLVAGLACIDLDGVIDEQGAAHPEAQRIVDALDGGYVEVSPSGRGLHVFVRGTLPSGWRKTNQWAIPLEMYDSVSGRYMTVTGCRWPSMRPDGQEIPDRTHALSELHATVAAVIDEHPKGSGAAGAAESDLSRKVARPPGEPLRDEVSILTRARLARNGAKFSRLWAGDISGYPSPSEADLALCRELAFWTGSDAVIIDRLFRQSGLMRAKWDTRHGAQTYGAMTLAKALAACGEIYGGARNPGRAANGAAAPPPEPEDGHGGLGLVTLGELLAEPNEAHKWVLEGRLPAGGLGLLAGKPKAGKSTLARCLAHAVARGEPCLGFTTIRGPVIYLALEEKRAEIREHFRALGGTDDEQIFVLCAAAPLDALERLRREAETRHPVLIIIDPLFRFVRVHDGNDYATMTAALEPLLVLARETSACVLLVHHLGKGQRNDGDNVLGSTAIFGAVDSALLMKRGLKYRTLLSIQRYGEDLEEITLALDPITRTVTAGGTLAAAEQADAERRILKFLAGTSTPVTEAEIADGVVCRTQPLRAALRALVAAGKVGRSGRGGKADPFQYALGTSTMEGGLL